MIDRREALAMLAIGRWRLAGESASGDPASGSSSATRQPPAANPFPIGLGTWQTFDVSDPKPLADVLSTFVQLGGTVIDSSPMYGRSEAVVGSLATSLGI